MQTLAGVRVVLSRKVEIPETAAQVGSPKPQMGKKDRLNKASDC